MTPCEKAGYKVGDQFIMLTDKHFYYSQGDIVTLGRDDGTCCPVFLGADGNPWVCITLDKVRPIKEDRITLRPGDYVSTEGMTEDQYHAVARAFANAGCPMFDDLPWMGTGDYLEWWNGELVSTSHVEPGGRHLTPAQVIGAVNAKRRPIRGYDVTLTITREEGNLEHKAGDRFIATKDSTLFSEGSIVRFTGEYGCFGNPKMELISGHCRLNNGPGGTPGAIERFERFEKIDHEGKQDMLTALLEAAETARENADQHQALADQASGEHDRLMQRARDMLPGGWMLVRGGVDWAKGEDMTDPANWREGDVIEALVNGLAYTKGRQYKITGFDRDGDPRFKDDDGDNMSRYAYKFRFHHRPT